MVILTILAMAAILIGAFICFCNWVYLYLSLTKKQFHSVVPLLGALFLGLGLAYFKTIRPYALLSIVADYGTILFMVSLPNLAKDFYGTSNFNLLRTLIANSQNPKISSDKKCP